jgi:hypothetical protein
VRRFVKHDALFKKLLRNRLILRAFFIEFFPGTAAYMDFDYIEYVDKERYTLEGKKRTGDLLIKTKFRDEPAFFLIHLEHQAQQDVNLGWRILEYLVLDRMEYGLPVYPVAILSHAEPATEDLFPLKLDFPNKRVLNFDFDVLDLRRLDAFDYIQRRNSAALALSARMKIRPGTRLEFVREFFISLATTEADDSEKELAAGFFSAYQPLRRKERLQLKDQLGKLDSMDREKVMRLTNPFIEIGIEQGIREGEVEMVLRLLKRRIGELPARQKKAIQRLGLAKIEALGESLLEFRSSADLFRWLKQNAS